MPKYIVAVPEVHYSMREVEANNPIEALDAAGDFGDEVSLDYSHTLDKEFWVIADSHPGRVSKKEDN